MTSQGAFAILDLRQRPEFRASVADRVWRAWWSRKGVARSTIEVKVADALTDVWLPSTWVACRGNDFLGTASLIACDLEARAELSPWVAAVWVEPPARRKGVGAGLVAAAANFALANGARSVWLCARPCVCTFYERLGWQRTEDDVGDDRLSIYTLSPREAKAPHSLSV